MHVQLTTGPNVRGSESLRERAKVMIEEALQRRFGQQITGIEVYLSDENSRRRSGPRDKRCVIEARLAGIDPIAVQNDAPTIGEALAGAVAKLRRTLGRRLGRLHDKGRP